MSAFPGTPSPLSVCARTLNWIGAQVSVPLGILTSSTLLCVSAVVEVLEKPLVKLFPRQVVIPCVTSRSRSLTRHGLQLTAPAGSVQSSVAVTGRVGSWMTPFTVKAVGSPVVPRMVVWSKNSPPPGFRSEFDRLMRPQPSLKFGMSGAFMSTAPLIRIALAMAGEGKTPKRSLNQSKTTAAAPATRGAAWLVPV